MGDTITYCLNPLDRVSHLRRDAAWLAERVRDPESRFLPFWKLQVLVKAGPPLELGWARTELCERMDAATGAVLLGVRDGLAHFAIDLSPVPDPVGALGLAGVARFAEPHAVVAGLGDGDAGIVAQGRGLLGWHARHRRCSVCGEPTTAREAGYMRTCDACDAQHFPRTDPVVIMLAHRGDRCLLGRQPSFPLGMWSTLAGFVEPGETLEEAVRREVLEETGVSVGAVRYYASQPWPFPANLMIGCLAEAQSEEIRVDRHELDDARWFTREQAARAVYEPARSEGLSIPPPMAIGHHLVKAWVDGAR
jgi:NAD+ diphosphatase